MAFRRDATLLGPGSAVLGSNGLSVDVQTDADLIMTATILGFSAGRLAAGEPVEFKCDSDEVGAARKVDGNLLSAVAKLNKALGKYRFGRTVEAGLTSEWKPGKAITGLASGARTDFGDRERVPSMVDAGSLSKMTARLNPKDTHLYQGRGAYAGLVEDPVADSTSLLMSTFRCNVLAQGEGARWVPPFAQPGSPWGLINDARHIDGMVEASTVGSLLVGYTHGMIQAVYQAVATGPWCTPFELVVGTKTKKLASCFACTLFMYAAGFPPSAIHLGKCESWVPSYPKRDDQGDSRATFAVTRSMNDAIRATNTRWYLECTQHLTLGADILGAGATVVKPSHLPRVACLKRYLSKPQNDLFTAANLILDAATVHSSDTDRVNRALAD